jgi:hypothetical protein
MKNPFTHGTHCWFIVETLNDGNWWNVIDIMSKYGYGIKNMAIRNRIADLKRKGIRIEARIGRNGQGEYRLPREPQSQATGQNQAERIDCSGKEQEEISPFKITQGNLF